MAETIHEICAVCLKDCKQSFSEWDWTKPIQKFCPKLEMSKSSLPFEVLKGIQSLVEGSELSFDEKTWHPQTKIYLEYLSNIEKLYVPCSNCGRLIAPDEVFSINDEEPICSDCFES